MAGTVKKYSIRIAGHATSISLEKPFWDELGRVAERQGLSVHELIARIDQNRADAPDGGNLSSWLRVYVLERLLAERQLKTGEGDG